VTPEPFPKTETVSRPFLSNKLVLAIAVIAILCEITITVLGVKALFPKKTAHTTYVYDAQGNLVQVDNSDGTSVVNHK
jgi:hypothetical protein